MEVEFLGEAKNLEEVRISDDGMFHDWEVRRSR
jgi:hypothetical protein